MQWRQNIVRIRQPLNKVDQRPHDTQGRSGSHDLITTWPPILNFTLFHTSNPPGPVPSNWPCHSVYIASIFLCIIILDWALLGEVLPNRSWKIQCCNFSFYFDFYYYFSIGKPWRHVVLHIWWQWSADRAWETESEVLTSEILYTHPVHPGVGFVRRHWRIEKPGCQLT